jgi:gluconolactonase
VYDLADVTTTGTGVRETEGIVADRQGNLWGAGRDGNLWRVDPSGNASAVARMPAGSRAGGIAIDRDANLVFCDQGLEAVMRFRDGAFEAVATSVAGVDLTTPNFLSYGADGTLYISNTTDDHDRIVAEVLDPAPRGCVVCIRPDGSEAMVAPGVYMANGLAVDPDEHAVYVLETSRLDCLRIPIQGDGTFGDAEVYVDQLPGLPDGMAFDALGNLYVTTLGSIGPDGFVPCGRIVQVRPSGSWEVLVEDPGNTKLLGPTNCACSGPDMRDLYVTNLEGDGFSHLRTEVAGHPLFHQR